MTTTLKLSNSQRVLLSVASSRTDGLLVFPKYLRRRTTDNLEQAGLIEPVTVTADDPMWSEDGNARSGYRVTIDGLLAIGIAAEKAIEIDSEAEQPTPIWWQSSPCRRIVSRTKRAEPRSTNPARTGHKTGASTRSPAAGRGGFARRPDAINQLAFPY